MPPAGGCGPGEGPGRAAAIRERTTRGMLLFNDGRVFRLEGSVWAVPSSRGGFWRVDLDDERCGCPDFVHRCRDEATGATVRACKHVIAAALARSRTQPAPRRVEDARSHHAPAYRAEVSRLTALGVEPPEEDE